ncbi:hypothetical protein AVEN_167857-1, partial [Araneus ventricosus]
YGGPGSSKGYVPNTEGPGILSVLPPYR